MYLESEGKKMKIIIIFFILQSINVILSTMKNLVMIKVNNKHLSAFVNALQFGFYTVVVKQIATLDLTTTVIITVITNIIGVYISYLLIELVRKERVWLIKTQPLGELESNRVMEELRENNISFNSMLVQDKTIFEIFSYSSNESLIIKEILNKSNGKIKIFITEMVHQL